MLILGVMKYQSHRLKLGVVGLSLAMALCASIGTCGNFYVATNGNDAWSGLLPTPNTNGTDGPFATLETARNAIRSSKAKSGLPVGGVQVNLMGGTFMRQSSFTLTASDSGTPSSPIVYQAYPGETPVIIGGMSVTNFQVVTNSTILARLTGSAKTNVLVANFTMLGITNVIPLAVHGYNLWWNWAGQNELFFNGKPMHLARWPNTNWLSTGATVGTNYFLYQGNNPSRWAASTDIWVHGFWKNDYADEFDKVSSIDTTSKIVYIAPPVSQLGYAANHRYYFANVLEELDSPGEYYIDRIHGLLYFWPPSDISAGNPFISTTGAGMVAYNWYGVSHGLVSLISVSNIVLSGITFAGSVGPNIYITYGQNNLITNCTLNGSSCDGLDLMDAVKTTVTDCIIDNMGECGVLMYDNSNSRLTLTAETNVVCNNTIDNMS